MASRRPDEPRHRRAALRLVPLLALAALPARADQVTLLPPASHVGFRAYGLGLIPFDGNFTRFHGWMQYDPAHPKACQVTLEIESASLHMSKDSLSDDVTGPEFMDSARFPDLAFHGACQGDTVVGSLLLHGETHPFTLDLTPDRTGGMLVASGRLRRADWGMTARPFTAGSTVRIQVEIPDPSAGSRT